MVIEWRIASIVGLAIVVFGACLRNGLVMLLPAILILVLHWRDLSLVKYFYASKAANKKAKGVS